jgi:hypothetical protein
MKAEDALRFINESPYVFHDIGHGVNLKFRVGKTEINIKKNNTRGGLDVFCPNDVFHFEWSSREKKWVPLKQREVSVC